MILVDAARFICEAGNRALAERYVFVALPLPFVSQAPRPPAGGPSYFSLGVLRTLVGRFVVLSFVDRFLWVG